MEVDETSFLFFRLSPSLVVSPFGLHLCIYLCTTDTLCLSCLPSGQPVRAYPSSTYLVGLSIINILIHQNCDK
jgi:hypothetical protein